MTSLTVARQVDWKRNLLVVWISQFLAMVGFGSCMPFIPLLLKDNLHVLDDHQRAFYVSVYYLASMLSICFATAVWGMLADRFGRKIMLLRASYAAALFYPLLAFAPNFQTLLAIRFVCSFFSGTVNPAQTLLVTTSPSDKHGFVLGTLSTAVWSGNMVGYMAGGLLVQAFGYTTAFVSCGGIYLLSGLLVHLFAQENFVRPVRAEAKEKNRHSFRELATPGILRLMLLFLIMGIARRIESPFIAMQVELVHGSDKAAFYTGLVSSAAALGGVFSGVLIGRLCDRFAPGRLAFPVVAMSVAGTLLQAFSVNIGMFIAARFLTYLAAGGIQPILQVMLTRIIKPELRGTYFGWSGSLNTGGGIICTLISGPIGLFASVRWIFATGGAILFLMIPLLIPTVRACDREKTAQ